VIVDPDFLDHWRTGMVTDALGDVMAPLYILRLWAHCQERKSDTFVMPTRGLKAQCKFPGDAETFERALIDAGFLKRNGDTLTVTGWAEKNASLFAAWENGLKGGRPRKQKPTGNPAVTHGEPMANPDETDKRREEKNSSSLRSEESRVRSVSILDLQADGLSEQTAEEFLIHRQRKKAKLTPRAWEGFKAEVLKAGWSNEQAVVKAMSRGWTGFEAEWVRSEQPRAQAPPAESFRERDQRIAAERVAQLGGGVAARPTREVFDVVARSVDRKDLRQDDGDLRLGLASDVGGR
jgi:hypothetical protein